MSAPFLRGQHVAIDGRGFHAVDSCVAVEGGLYLLRLLQEGDGDVFTIEIHQDKGRAWRNEDLEAVTVVDGPVGDVRDEPRDQLDLFAEGRG